MSGKYTGILLKRYTRVRDSCLDTNKTHNEYTPSYTCRSRPETAISLLSTKKLRSALVTAVKLSTLAYNETQWKHDFLVQVFDQFSPEHRAFGLL